MIDRLRSFRVIAMTMLLAALPAAAFAAVGHVAGVEGEAEIGRAGTFAPAETGTGIEVGDELRTGAGRLRVVFQDDSVLNLVENTRVVVDEHVFQPEEGTFSSVMKLLEGKVRAAVSEYYQTSEAQYEIETPTAIAGVRGTTFLVTYDSASNVTEVVGIRGSVHVRNLDERLGDGVLVTAQEVTTVAPGQAPEPPTRLDERLFRERLDSVEVLGRVDVGGVGAAALQAGGEAAVADRAPEASSQSTSLEDLRDASDVVGQPLPVVETTRGRLGVPLP